jgi:predicted lysophospholipase L1 biosynthesis ABC-type transport system permease subunit
MQPDEPAQSRGEDEPAQADGVVAATVGTALWAVALVVTFLLRDRLRNSGAQWWVWTCATGFGLGLLGTWWVRRRRDRLAARPVNRSEDA